MQLHVSTHIAADCSTDVLFKHDVPPEIDEIRFPMSNKFIDLIAFNETRLDSSITDGMTHFNDYALIRKDKSRNKGGACIYLRSSINYKIRDDLVPAQIEAVCTEIIKPYSKPFLVSIVYRPSNASSGFFDHFENLIKVIEMYVPPSGSEL